MASRKLYQIRISKYLQSEDLNDIRALNFDQAYQEYGYGIWETLSIWNKDGRNGDAISKEYEGSAQINDTGKDLHNINRMINDHFECRHIKSVRLLRSCKGGMILPHFDYLEFQNGFTRLHVVLDIDDTCLNSEGDVVYQMEAGDVWFLDGRELHSATSISPSGKLCLMIDFSPHEPFERLFKSTPLLDHPPISTPLVRNKPMEDALVSALLTLNQYSPSHRVKDIMAILNQFCFERKVPHSAFYPLLDQVFDVRVNPNNHEIYQHIKSIMIVSGHHES
ncbi:aspartyl/asparaginyl beta-hydroxylase domain-containing protein [Vibrio ouci]|uniref:aspartyl/asparaginyl beta-hydroxylase domain-containing protein n=1 Tax=Vibrio ouci TaxID=2499078 RepID=UPI00142D8B20|nr:aspartyl/asparaginyl beta-hydroxylase domain-containing protein [Vibrio ouci]